MDLFHFQTLKMIRWVFVLMLFVAFHEEINSKRTKYLIDVERIEQCPEPKYKNVETPMTNIKIYRLNDTVRAFNLDFEVKRPWDADVGMSMELDVWGYAGWTHIPYVSLQPDFCNSLRSMFPGVLTEVLQNIGVEHPDKCPIEPGLYSFKNYTCDNTIIGNNFPFKGRFRTRSILVSLSTKKLIVCALCTLTAKENLKV